MQPPVLLFVGPAGHGKRQAREFAQAILSDISGDTGTHGASVSQVLEQFAAFLKQQPLEELRKQEGFPGLVAAAARCLTGDPGTPELLDPQKDPAVDPLADIYRAPSAMLRTLYLNGYNLIDACATALEIQHFRQHLEWNGIRLYVISVGHRDDAALADSDAILCNDGTPEQLREKVEQVLRGLFPNDFKQEEQKGAA